MPLHLILPKRDVKETSVSLIINISRRGDRVAEGAALEMLCAG